MWRLVPQQHGRALGWGVGYGLRDPPSPGPGGCPMPQSFLGRVPPQETQDFSFFFFFLLFHLIRDEMSSSSSCPQITFSWVKSQP